uniref:Uncharacterized protein n=1 Tax=Alexandrium catenella TaxID=2925 RepID=A0A7S1RN15_ALECA
MARRAGDLLPTMRQQGIARRGGPTRRSVVRLLALSVAATAALVSRAAWCNPGPAAGSPSEREVQAAPRQGRRQQLLVALAGAAAADVPRRSQEGGTAAWAADGSAADLVAEIRQDKTLLEPLFEVLKQEQWDKVRTVLKNPPVGKLWNLGPSKNPLKKLGDIIGDPSVFELGEEIASALQLADQFTYDNNFIKYQPGDGKVNIKVPSEQLQIAIKKLEEVLQLAADSR